jgi:hypothetical protein
LLSPGLARLGLVPWWCVLLDGIPVHYGSAYLGAWDNPFLMAGRDAVRAAGAEVHLGKKGSLA